MATARALAAVRLLLGAAAPSSGPGRAEAKLASILADLLQGSAAEKAAAKERALKLLEAGACKLRMADSGVVGSGGNQPELFDNE